MAGTNGSCPTLPDIVSTFENFFNWMSNTRKNCPGVTATQVHRRLLDYDNGSANPTVISNLETQIADKTKELETKRADASIAKDRASSIVRPELQSSYYDGWFPLNRPLKRAAVPILVFFASLFISIAFFLMLGLIGIHSHFFVIVPGGTSGTNMTKPFFMLLSFTVILFCITIYSFLR
jgi:hypothetical protein